MKWTDEMRAELRRLHAQGLTDTQIAQILGENRNTIANYRHHVLDLPVNHAKLAMCPKCGARKRNLQLHAVKAHGASPLAKTPGAHFRRLKRVPGAAVLNPKNGNFDSAAALSFLVDNWRKRAA